MKYVATCGHEHTISVSNFLSGKGRLCPKCRRKDIAGRQKLGEDKIRCAFEKEGCKVISSGFSTSTDPVTYIARCGHENTTDYSHFVGQRMGRVCNVCSKSIRYDYEAVKKAFSDRGCVLLEERYINCKTSMRYIATCGHETHIDFDRFMNSKDYHPMCLRCLCAAVKRGDIKSKRWSFELTEWRSEVFSRDGYKCQFCGRASNKLNAHHIRSFSAFPELGYDVDNGVTLCAECHRAFHRFYGPRTTEKELQDFKEILEILEGNTEVS